jgi:putative ABC transport system permease protein
VTPGYLETMRIPLRRGRLLDARDAAGAPPAVLLSESLARSRFPDADAIGQRVRIGPDDGPWSTIVGIVGNVRQTSLAANEPDAVYLPNTQWKFADRALWLVVRARGDAPALTQAVKAAIWSVDKDQPIVRVATMDDLVAASAAERRFALIVFEAFALAALLLAAIGLYGILSGSVAERTREIGVRSALGASRGSILSLVMRQGMTLVGMGAVIGLGGAMAASGALVTLLFGTSRLDPVTHVGVVLLLATVSAIACGIPAWRAARVDPTVALRCD